MIEINKKNIILGTISLFISAILLAVFSCYLQKNWGILGLTCIFAVMFLKYLKDDSVVNWLICHVSKDTLKIIGIIVLFIGIALLPPSLGHHLEINVKFVTYMASYICWMVGLLLINIAGEKK